MGLNVCVSYPKVHVQSSPNFLCMLPIRVAVVWSSSGGVLVHYVIPGFWITSCLHIMARNSGREKGVYSK